MTLAAKAFWDSLDPKTAAAYLRAAPSKIAMGWKKDRYKLAVRPDPYTGQSLAEIRKWYDEKKPSFEWSVWHAWLNSMGPEASGRSKTLEGAKRAADRMLKKLGYTLI